MRIPRVAPMSTRFFKRPKSTRGASDRFSTYTNAIAAATETMRLPIVANDPQPQSAPLLSARMRGARIAATRKVPAQSMVRDRSGSIDSFTPLSVNGTQSPATINVIQNKVCQPEVPTNTPPTRGPMAAPIAEAAPQSDTALSRSAPVDATVSRLMPQARMVDPAAPCIALPPMTPHSEVDRAIRTQDAMKRNSPPRKIFLRPKTSPRAPEVTMKAAPTSE
jgi:hypothetical protein